MPSAAWFSQAIEAEEGDNEEEEGREGRRAHPRLGCAWLPALFLSLMSVSQRNTRLANGKATGESSALARSGTRRRDGRERRRHLYLSLVKFRRRREQKTGEREGGRERTTRRAKEQQSSSSSLSWSSLPPYRLRPSVLPREVEPGKKVVSPSNSKFSIGRTGEASSANKGDFV